MINDTEHIFIGNKDLKIMSTEKLLNIKNNVILKITELDEIT